MISPFSKPRKYFCTIGLVLAVYPVLVITLKPELPSYLKVCNQSDPHLNQCIKESINSILKNIKHGSQELGLQPIDPFNIPHLEIREGTENDNVTLWMTLKRTNLIGLSDTEVLSVRSNSIDKKLEIVCKSPFLDIAGDFTSDGAVLTLPLAAAGDFYINMSDVTAIWILYYNRVRVGANRFLAIDELHVDIIPSSIAYHFGDALDGEIALGEAMNNFINENSHEIFTVIKPKIGKLFKEIFTQIATQVLRNYPDDVLLPP